LPDNWGIGLGVNGRTPQMESKNGDRGVFYESQSLRRER